MLPPLRRFCNLNNDSRFDTCEVPQEIDNDEIDILLKAQQDAEEQGRGDAMVSGLPSGAKAGSAWNKKEKKTLAADGKAAAGVNDNVWHRIHRNIFTHREPKSVTEDDVLICSCIPDPVTGAGCGDECINRDVLVECDPNFCPCGASCQNQKFQSKKYAKLDIRRTGKKGHGLFTKQALKKGEFIIEYVGEVLHEDEYRARKNRYEAEEKRHYYFMTLSSSETIDAAERGNAGRFLNHSCQPNCETQKWMVNGELCIGIFALEDISPDAELTFDYNFERYGDNPIKCYCGTKKCGGWIGGGQKDGDDDGVPGGASAAAEEDDPEDYHEPAPVMLEADEEEIAAEESRGREARVRARLSNRRGGGGEPFKPKDVYGNDDDDYDGDGEIAARKKEAQREANRAAREANRAEGRSGSSGGLRRSGSSSLGTSRKGSAGSFKRTSSSLYVPSYYGTPSTAKRRSEVDVSMERLRGASGALRNAKAAVKCVRLFNLAYPVTAAGTQSVSQRDLGLLLEAVALTTNPQTQIALVEKGLLQALQMCVQRLGGAEASADHVPILRKVVKIIDAIAVNSPSVVTQRLQDTRTARGSLAQAIADLRAAKDPGLRTLAASLVDRLPAGAAARGVDGPPPGAPPRAPGAGHPPGAMGPGSVTGSVSSPASSIASRRDGDAFPGMPGMGSRGWGPGPGDGLAGQRTPLGRGPPPGREGGYAPGFVTPGGVVPGVSARGHGEHFDRRGVAGDPGAGTPLGMGAGTPLGMGAEGAGTPASSAAAGRGAPPGSAGRDGGLGAFAGASAGKPARPGDWLCPHGCGNVFASKPRCFRCGAPRPRDAHTFGGGYGGGGYGGAGGVGGGGAGSAGSAFSRGGGGAFPGSGRKRDREAFEPGSVSAPVAPPRSGGWGGIVRSGPESDSRDSRAPARAGGSSGPGGFDSRVPAPPPGMGVASARAAAPAAPRQEPLPTHPPRLPPQWDSPLTQKFGDDVRALVGWSLVPFRRPAHPLFVAGANYDRLAAKLTNAVVEKEQTKWREQNAPIPRGALEERLGRYCANQVKAMHAEHLGKAGNP